MEYYFHKEDKMDELELERTFLARELPEEFIAGGMLARKKYEEIEGKLEEFGYKRIKGEA